MARYLVLPLILLLALVALLVYVGNDQWVQLELLPQSTDAKPVHGIAMSLQAAILAAVGGIAGVILIWSLLMWIRRLPKRMKTGFGRKREVSGLEAVESALLASEAGDGVRALRQAKRAQELLNRPSLTELVSAKAAEASDDIVEASGHYTALLDDPKTEAAGLRGLARLAEKQGDFHTVIEMAKAAYMPSKGPLWAFDLLFSSQVSLSDWDGAIQSVSLAEKRKHVNKEGSRRRRTALLAAKAAHLETTGQMDAAITASLRAAELNPGFAPASALAARLLTHNGQAKKAAILLEKAWSQAPHPALAIAYRDIFNGETDKVRTKKINSFVKTNPAHRESFILNAEEALRDNKGPAALQALGNLLREEDPSARLCMLASAAEDMLGNPVDARAWHVRAASAPVEADWSDLDPDGPAFKYTDKDWQRLVLSYGITGELIHPRYESFKRRRTVVGSSESLEDKPAIEVAAKNSPAADFVSESTEDLSTRLDNLLDD